NTVAVGQQPIKRRRVHAQSITGELGSRVEDIVYVAQAKRLPPPRCERAVARLPSNQIDDLAAILGAKDKCTLTFMIEAECCVVEANCSATDGPQDFVPYTLIEKQQKLIIFREPPRAIHRR